MWDHQRRPVPDDRSWAWSVPLLGRNDVHRHSPRCGRHLQCAARGDQLQRAAGVDRWRKWCGGGLPGSHRVCGNQRRAEHSGQPTPPCTGDCKSDHILCAFNLLLHPQIFRSSALTRQIHLKPIIPLCTNAFLVTATELSVGCVGAGGAGGAQLW